MCKNVTQGSVQDLPHHNGHGIGLSFIISQESRVPRLKDKTLAKFCWLCNALTHCVLQLPVGPLEQVVFMEQPCTTLQTVHRAALANCAIACTQQLVTANKSALDFQLCIALVQCILRCLSSPHSVHITITEQAVYCCRL